MTMISDLPIEIMWLILEMALYKGRLTYLKLQLDEAALSKYREQQDLIRELGSVCRRWRSICLEFLFEHVWIAPPSVPNTLTFRQIFDTSGLCGHSRKPPGWWTRHLYLDVGFLEPPERKALVDHFQINNPFPNVEHLFILDHGSKGDKENSNVILGIYAKHLASLTLKGPVTTVRNMICRAPGGLSQLQELALEFSWSVKPSLASRDKRDPLVLPGVHTLHIRPFTRYDYLVLLDWGFPSLRTLNIYKANISQGDFSPFIRLYGPMLVSLSIPYWPVAPSDYIALFGACLALERLEVLDGLWIDDDTIKLVSLEYFPIMEEHCLREWTFKPFWAKSESECFDPTLKDCTADPKLFPSLQKIRLLSPGVDKLWSLSPNRVQYLKDWSRALNLKGVSLVDDEDGVSIFSSTICVGGGSDWHSSPLFPIILYSLKRATHGHHIRHMVANGSSQA